jgi:hypothetical protein
LVRTADRERLDNDVTSMEASRSKTASEPAPFFPENLSFDGGDCLFPFKKFPVFLSAN